MPRTEHIRQPVSGPLELDEIEKFQKLGWRVIAVEWEREAAGAEPGAIRGRIENPPFGLRVAQDCSALEEDRNETEILLTMMELLIEDGPYSFIAEELNRRGYRTREGSKWGPVAVFEMLPRLIDAGPGIFSTEEWGRRRQESRMRQQR